MGVGLTLRWRGNVLSVVDASRNRLFQCVDGAGDGLFPVVPKRGQLGEVGGGRQRAPDRVLASWEEPLH